MKKKIVRSALAVVVAAFAVLTYSINFSQAHEDYLARKSNKVVMLSNPEGTSGGTGFFIRAPSGKTYILTNQHVCGLAVNNSITIDKQYQAPVVAIYPMHDLCLLGNPLNVAGLSIADGVRNQEDIYVLGHPLLEPKSLVKGKISGEMEITLAYGYNVPNCSGPTYINQDMTGTLSEIFGIHSICFRKLNSYPVTANILPGNSGSPVLNKFGNVVGVAFAGEEGSGRGFIIPYSELVSFLRNK